MEPMLKEPFAVPPGTPPNEAHSALRESVANRLRNACAGWSQEDFDALVDKVTDIAIKYAVPGSGNRAT
jgi:hypothetical protein